MAVRHILLHVDFAHSSFRSNGSLVCSHLSCIVASFLTVRHQ